MCSSFCQMQLMSMTFWSRNVSANFPMKTFCPRWETKCDIEIGFCVFFYRILFFQNNRWKRQNMQNSIALACSSDFQSDLNEFIDCDEYYPIVDAEPLKAHDELRCDRLIRLNGPRSPLESEVYSVLVSNDKRSVEIDHHSVNSVFLTSLQQVWF